MPSQALVAPPAPQRQNGFAQMLNTQKNAVQTAEAHASQKRDANAEANEEATGQKPAVNQRPTAKMDQGKDKVGKPRGPDKTQDKAQDKDKSKVEGSDAAVGKDKSTSATDDVRADAATAVNAPVDQPPGLVAPTDPALAAAAAASAEGAAKDAGKADPLGDESADTQADTLGLGGSKKARPDAMVDVGGTDKSRDAGDMRGGMKAQADVAASSAWQAAAEQASLPVSSEKKPATQELPGIGGVGAAGAAGGSLATARAAEAASPSVAQVPTPVTSPEFPQALGVQISVFARDGIQNAELHLNPAEMGPISVQIALDGTQAQVNFGADSAATRHIIEGGLPELAAAMRDAGFTLSGGGVHQQSSGTRDGRGDGQAHGDSSGTGQGDRDAGALAPVAMRARVAAGGVDLYA
jgi:flagellar hook-length control protein FliK